MISPWTKPGTKVVCIDAVAHTRYMRGVPTRALMPLVEGEVYTVLNVHQTDADIGGFTVYLSEIPLRSTFDNGYSLRRFRPAELPRCLTDILIAVPLAISDMEQAR